MEKQIFIVNKISNKNYDVQRESIFQLIRQAIEIDSSLDSTECQDHDQQCNLKKISSAIFNIASTNKFYSEIYANLYKDLIGEFPVFTVAVDGFAQQYLDSIENIVYVDQTLDYDKYCDNNKLNDKRRAMAAFIVNLMSRDIIDKSTVLNIIIRLEETVMKYIDEPNRTYEVEELTENIFVFITMSISFLINVEGWDTIITNLKTCSQYKPKEHKSLSSRALFKYMDIQDFIKKNSK